MTNQTKTGVVSKNSIAYVRTVFESYANDETVVLLRNKDDNRIQLTGVEKVIDPIKEKGWYKQNYVFRYDTNIAQIAFTSGTEGEPKGVLLTHEALNDVTERLNNIMEVDDSIREYVGIPANFSFGLGRFRAISAAGGQAYLPENGFDPMEIKTMLSVGEINAISAVPSLWRVLLKCKEIFGSEVEQLKWIEIGSQYMSRSEKEELVALFPKAKIAQHYGLTEASRSSFLRLEQTKGEHLESVGRAYGKTEFKVSDNGRICIRGPHVSQTLLKNGEYVSNIDADGWFETRDSGHITDGYLYYKGRADDLINCGGIKLSPDALERELREKIQLKEGVAIAAVDDELTGHAVLVAYRDDISIAEKDLVDATSDVLKSFGLNNRKMVKTIKIESFPMTSTNKVKRKELAKLYQQLSTVNKELEHGKIEKTRFSLNEQEQKIADIWVDVLKLDSVDPDLNFYDLGGDSLSAIGALVAMETKGVPKEISKGMLQGMTVREIAAKMSEGQESPDIGYEIRSLSIRNTMTVSIVRGLMVLLVIFAHWHQGFFERIPNFNSELLTSRLGPLLAMGTPGFAIIYGVGAGYSLYPLVQSDPERLRVILSKTSKFLLTGIIMLAIVQFSEILANQDLITFTDFTNSFFSVQTYYLLVSATLLYWFRLINKVDQPMAFTALLAVVAYTVHVYLIDGFGVIQTSGVLELLKLLFTAKYAYFLMLSGTFLGITIGMMLYNLTRQSKPLTAFLLPVWQCLY